MKILHLMLSCFYIDNANYQENIIPKINKKDGHEVYIVASRDTFLNNMEIGMTAAGSYTNEHGIPVTRLEYKNFFSDFLSMKIRSYKRLYKKMEEISPDVILFHGIAAADLNTVGKYIKRHPNVKLYVDSHEDFNNSARGFLSKNILHNLFYKRILYRNLRYIEKIFYITKETYNFLHDFYKISSEKLFFLPLGGELPTDEEYKENRKKRRKELNLSETDILCIHSGKLDKLKRTEEKLAAFSSVPRTDLKLIIIGKVEKQFEQVLKKYIDSDPRIIYLGWKQASELREYLMAGDLYLQLGSQSATMQQAVCNHCVVALYPFESHTYLLNDSAYYISTQGDLELLLKNITLEAIDIKRKKAIEIAKNLLDYRKISNFF